MTEIRYALLDPTGNQTILVESEVPPECQPSVARQIMDLEPEAEQAGFVRARPGGISLRMAGGEFCGNAAMSAAALYAFENGIAEGTIPVTVSGTPDPVAVTVSALPDGRMKGRVEMPRPVSVGEEDLPGGMRAPVVRFHGISHVILESPLDRETAERLAPVWCRGLNAESAGIMMFDREAGSLVPLVYVPTAGTLFWENSCASGTTAVGAFLAAKEGSVSLDLRQPGGTLHVESDADGKLFLTGTVRLRVRRTASVLI